MGLERTSITRDRPQSAKSRLRFQAPEAAPDESRTDAVCGAGFCETAAGERAEAERQAQKAKLARAAKAPSQPAAASSGR